MSGIVISNVKPVASGAMRCVFDVSLPSGLVLHRCSAFTKDGKVWAAPPSKQVIGRDGSVQKTADANSYYEPVVSFVDRATQERWSSAVVAALAEAHPGVLE